MLKHLIPMLLFLTALCILPGCRTRDVIPDFDFKPGAEDQITKAEQDALIWHARQFVSNSKRLRITPEAKKMVLQTNPKLTLKYFASKYGQIIMRWELSRVTVLELSGTGHMTDKRFPWKLDIRTQEISHPVPENMQKNLPKSDF